MRTNKLQARTLESLRDVCRNLDIACSGLNKYEMIVAIEDAVGNAYTTFETKQFVKVMLPHGDDNTLVQTDHPKAQKWGIRLLRKRSWRIPVIQHSRLPSLSDICATQDIESMADEQRLEVRESREEYGRMACVLTVPFRTMDDLMAGNESWWDAWCSHRESLQQATRAGLCSGGKDQRALYGAPSRRRLAELSRRNDALKVEQENTRRQTSRQTRLQRAITAMEASIQRAEAACESFNQRWIAHCRWCRDCAAVNMQSPSCSHGVPFSTRCTQCDNLKRDRRDAFERLKLPKFQRTSKPFAHTTECQSTKQRRLSFPHAAPFSFGANCRMPTSISHFPHTTRNPTAHRGILPRTGYPNNRRRERRRKAP